MLPEAETFYARSIFDEYWRLWPAGHVVDEFKLTVTGAAFIATAVLPCAPLFIRTPVWLAFMTTPAEIYNHHRQQMNKHSAVAIA